jgi:hypothetical protein
LIQKTSAKFRLDCFMLHTTTIFTMIDCCCTIQGLLSYSPPLLHCDIYRWKIVEIHKIIYVLCEKRQHWTLYKTRYYKLWKKNNWNINLTLHIYIYYFCDIPTSNYNTYKQIWDKQWSAQNVKSCLKFNYYYSFFYKKKLQNRNKTLFF